MIHKNIGYGQTDNVIVAEFGCGTLAVVNGENEGYQSLLMKTKEHSPIGAVSGFEQNSDEFKPEVALVFRSKQSFDVFYEFVQNIKKNFDGILETPLAV